MPSTTGAFAPVTDGRLAGTPLMVSWANTAKAMASNAWLFTPACSMDVTRSGPNSPFQGSQEFPVTHTAAPGDHLVNRPWPGLANRSRNTCTSRRQRVFQRQAVSRGDLPDLPDIAFTEFFTPRGFRGLLRKERMPQECLHEYVLLAAASGQGPVPIDRPLPVRGLRQQPVQQQVAGTHVKRDHVVQPAGTRQPGHVCNAAEIDDQPRLPPGLKHVIMHVRRQRRPFSTRGQIPRTKIGDGRDARALGNDRRIADLQRGPDRSAPRHWRLLGTVPHGLAMPSR